MFAGLADGTLAAPVTYATAGSYGQRPETVDIGDVNGDGRPDVVVGLSGLGIQLFAQAADGTLAAPILVPSIDSHKVAIGDFDKSGRAQVAGIGWGTDTVTVFANTGAGLAAAATYPAQHDGWDDLEAADVTGDGRTDIVVMSGQGLVPNVSVLPRSPMATFGAAAEYAVGGSRAHAGHRRRRRDGRRAERRRRELRRQQPDRAARGVRAVAGGHARRPAGHVPELRHPGRGRGLGRDRDGRADAVVVHEGWLRVGVYRGQVGGKLGAEDLYPSRTRTMATRTASRSATSPATAGRTS